MLRGILALFFRSLRSDARSLWAQLSWFFLLIVIYLAMWSVEKQNTTIGAPGLIFFQYVIRANAIIVTILGISYFSSAISEEKEEDTLGLMMMAGISPLGILLGKSTTRLLQVALLLTVQYPFTLLAVTMGGLTPDQIYAAYAALLAYTVLLANVGLFSSVLCQRNRDAAALTTLWLVSYFLGPVFAWFGLEFLKSSPQKYWIPPWIVDGLAPILLWISSTNVFHELDSMTKTGYHLSLTPQLISNSIGGVLTFLFSYRFFSSSTFDSSSPPVGREPAHQTGNRPNWCSAGRSWNAAMIWKDFHFVTGGWLGIAMRSGLYFGLYMLAFASSSRSSEWSNSREIFWSDITWVYQIFVTPLFALDCALCASRLFQDEIRNQTLGSLLILPHSVVYLVYNKIAGNIIGLIPGFVALLVAFLLLPESKTSLAELIWNPKAWWLAVNLLIVIHMSAMLSTYLRWGAFAISLAIMTFTMVMYSGFIQTLSIFFEMTQFRTDLIFAAYIIVLLVACACCHFVVLLRLTALGEK